MNTFAEYLIKSGVSLAVLYLFYWMFLRKGTHFRLNRIVLLFSLLVSLLVPVISLNIFTTPKFQASLPEFTVSLNEFVVNATTPVIHATPDSFNWWKVLSVIYLIGVSIVLARLVYQGIYLHVMSKLSKTIQRGNFTIVLMNADITPFAYFNKIFIPASKTDDFSIDSIIAHERSHQQQFHFADLFLMQLGTVLQWFNPAMWLYERSLKEVHEYLADEAVLRQGQNKGVYQALLVNEAMGGPVFSLTNQFNKSLIKKRIVMMSKMKTPRFAQLKALLVLPLIALLLVAFASPKNVITPIVEKGNELMNSISKTPQSEVLPKDTISKTSKGDEPVKFPEQAPEFTGGQKAMMKFLTEKVKYPAEAVKKKVAGRVIVQFIVDREGKVGNIKILRGIGAGCDEEAVRVIKLMPNWKPGKDKGKNVSAYFTLPVVFMLKDDKEEKQVKENGQPAVQYAEHMPQYPGGQDSMMRFLAKNIKYPKEAIDKKITGRVIAQFIVDKNGKISSPKVLRGIGGGCDEEAIRVINLMPNWKPGKDKGKEVDVYFTLPIVFAQKD
jgi:TonB family protein